MNHWKLSIAILLGVTMATSAAEAGCGIEITFNNTLKRPVTVDKNQSKVRVVSGGLGTSITPIGTWAKFLGNNVTVKSGKTKKHKTSLKQSCKAGTRQFKFLIADGNKIIRREKIVVIPIKKKFKVNIK